MTRRHLSRSRALPAALLIGALAIPAVTGCEAGLNAPTLAFHPAADGATASSGDVTISNAFILGPTLGQQLPAGGQAGLFVSISSTGGDQLTQVTADGVSSAVQITGGTVSIPANGAANLTGPAPQLVLTNLSTALSGGQTVTLKFDFANAGQLTVQVPVQPQAYDYATYAQPASPTPSLSPSATTSAAPSKSASPSPKP